MGWVSDRRRYKRRRGKLVSYHQGAVFKHDWLKRGLLIGADLCCCIGGYLDKYGPESAFSVKSLSLQLKFIKT